MCRYIDADALIERIKYSFHNHERVRIDTVTETFLTEYCSPTINPEDLRPKGKWIKIGEICGIDILECPVCHTYHTQNGDAFCRDCGADMRDGAKMEE